MLNSVVTNVEGGAKFEIEGMNAVKIAMAMKEVNNFKGSDHQLLSVEGLRGRE